jgi:Putative transposase
VHNAVTVPPDDRVGLERLARYLLRAPVSLERLSFDPASDRIAYARRPGRGHDHEPAIAERLTDSKELLARFLLHIPEPRRHAIRHYGAYSNVARVRRARQTAAAGSAGARSMFSSERGVALPGRSVGRGNAASLAA